MQGDWALQEEGVAPKAEAESAGDKFPVLVRLCLGQGLSPTNVSTGPRRLGLKNVYHSALDKSVPVAVPTQCARCQFKGSNNMNNNDSSL